jgi:hypothetical protein
MGDIVYGNQDLPQLMKELENEIERKSNSDLNKLLF